MRDRHTVRGTQTAEVMALHRAGETLTLGGANDIDLLTGDEVARGDGRANIKDSVLGDAKLGELRLRQHIGLGKMTTHRLRHVLCLCRTGAKLHGGITVALLLAHRNNLDVVHFQYRDRNMTTGIGKYPRHTQLAGDNSATHWSCPFPRA